MLGAKATTGVPTFSLMDKENAKFSAMDVNLRKMKSLMLTQDQDTPNLSSITKHAHISASGVTSKKLLIFAQIFRQELTAKL